jgi:rare lipoprotein A
MQNRWARGAIVLAATALLAACGGVPNLPGLPGGGSGSVAVRAPVVNDPAPFVSGTMRRYQVRGRWYEPSEQPRYDEVGLASWYGAQFNGRPTATGERFDMTAMTAAHKTLPLPALVEVTNQANGRAVIVRINDRGPFVDGRIIDLSRGAAEELGMLSQGVGQVRVRYLGPAPRGGGTGVGRLQQASRSDARQPDARTPDTRAESRPPRLQDAQYWIQAGSFSDSFAARMAAESLGGDARVNPATVDGRQVFRVMLGPWSDADSAERARQSVIGRGVRDALLISGG